MYIADVEPLLPCVDFERTVLQACVRQRRVENKREGTAPSTPLPFERSVFHPHQPLALFFYLILPPPLSLQFSQGCRDGVRPDQDMSVDGMVFDAEHAAMITQLRRIALGSASS